jgi:hypothetical protein
VRFCVIGGGSPGGSFTPVEVPTNGHGIAEAPPWDLGVGPGLQVVEATLRDAADNAIHLPVHYTASRPRVAAQVPFDPAHCPPLAGTRTVQEAIERLCGLEHVGCCTTVGKDGRYETIEEALKDLLEQGQQHVCLCLAPGRHRYTSGVGFERFQTVAISGQRRGSVVEMREPVVVAGLQSFSLSDVSVTGDGLQALSFQKDSVCCRHAREPAPTGRRRHPVLFQSVWMYACQQPPRRETAARIDDLLPFDVKGDSRQKTG